MGRGGKVGRGGGRARRDHESGVEVMAQRAPSRARAALPWIVPAAAVIAWQARGHAPPGTMQLPSPLQIARAGLRLAATGELAHHGWVSLERALLGLAVGGGVGLVFGLVNGYWSLAEEVLDTSIQMLRNVPHLALVPLLILWLGLGEAPKVLLVALGVLFPVYVNTYHGVRSVDPALLEMGRLYGLRPLALFRQIVLPSALPSILVGLRFALGVMWLSLIVAETVAADAGIGYLALNAREFMQTDVVILSILLYASLGKLADLVARALERRCLAWMPPSTNQQVPAS
jgi:sulfonate transport system permease protein